MIDRRLWTATSSKKYHNRLYKIWSNMLYRCYHKPSKYNKSGARYYNRNIRVCEDWKYDFWNFYHWAKQNGYKKELTIDRINNDENYEPNNCRWATVEEQSYNKSTTIKIKDPKTHCENTETILQLSKKYNIPKQALTNWYYKYKKGILTEKEWRNRFKWLVEKYKDR